MTNRTGRPKTNYDIDEVKEILDRKLQSIDFDYSKFTYNSVFKYNQYLVNKRVLNSKGNIFTLYGYAFWAADYNGVSNYGKEQINLYKQGAKPKVAGEFFAVDTADVEAIIDANINNPYQMKKLLVKMFKNERKSNANNDKKFHEMQKELKEYQELAEQYKNALFMLFYNSQYSDNQLLNMMTLDNENNSYIKNEINDIFKGDSTLLVSPYGTENNTNLVKDKLEKEIETNVYDLASFFTKK